MKKEQIVEKEVVVDRVIPVPKKQPEPQPKPILAVLPNTLEDDDWGEVSYRGPDLKAEERGVFNINEATMSYSVMSGPEKFYFSIQTKALNQTFNLYNDVYFGKQYEAAAREELAAMGVAAPSTRKVAK